MDTIALLVIGIWLLLQVGFLFFVIPNIDLAGPRWAIYAVRSNGAIVYLTATIIIGNVWYRVWEGQAQWWADPLFVAVISLHVLGNLAGGALMAYFASPKVYNAKHYEETLQRRIKELEAEYRDSVT